MFSCKAWALSLFASCQPGVVGLFTHPSGNSDAKFYREADPAEVDLSTAGGYEDAECIRPIRQFLQNDDDVSFLGKIRVGSQVLNVIPDTGSYEMVIFSDSCTGCGSQEKLYHDDRSTTLRTGELQAKQSYGSGVTSSQEAYDNVHMGCLTVRQQMFWRVYSAHMPILQSGTFQGIFGLGPPGSNVRMAKEEVEHIEHEVTRMKDAGIDVSPYMATLQNLRDVHQFSKRVKLWLNNLRMRTFSICLQHGAGKPGVFVYNDDSVEQHPSQFTKVRNFGDLYWSTKMSNVKVGGRMLDCTDSQKCIAIMDTGTSLIAAPAGVVRELENLVGELGKKSSNCEDLSIFPNLDFELDGQQFTLPPEAYVGVIEGETPEWALDVLPSLRRNRELRRSLSDVDGNYSYCSLLLMKMDQADDTNQWIFGVPFFRHYYTSFHLDQESLTADSMYMAEADESCEVGESSRLRVPAILPTGPLRIDAAKLRPPRRWANRNRAKYDMEFY